VKTEVEQILNDMKEKKIIDDGSFTNFYGGKTDNGYKLKINGEEKMKEKELTPEDVALSFLPNSEVDNDTDFIIGFEFGAKWQQGQALEMEKQQNEKYNELKEVIEDMIKHLDEGIVLTLRKDSIIVKALRNSINKK
jgi:hypothetical protein